MDSTIKAQTSLEFIMILAVTLVILGSLLVVLTQTSEPPSAPMHTGPIGIIDITATPVRNTITLQNNLDTTITITQIRINNNIVRERNIRLTPFESARIDVYNPLLTPNDILSGSLHIQYLAQNVERTITIDINKRIELLADYDIQLSESIANDIVFIAKFNNNTLLGESSTSFLDTATGIMGTCASCPTIVSEGFSTAVEFSTDRIVFPTTLKQIEDTFTVSMWIYSTSTGKQTKIDTGVISGGTGLKLSYNNEELQVERRTTSNDYLLTIRDIPNYTPQWHHIALVQTDTQLLPYINGQAGMPIALHEITPFSHNISIGASVTNNDHFSGKIDSVAWWSRPLTPNEIQSLYLRGIWEGINE